MGASFSPKATPPRPATSRLLAMKFMNRLGPSDATPTSSSPLASGPSTPLSQKDVSARALDPEEDGISAETGEEDDQPSAKRRKISAASSLAPSPAAGATVADMEATMRASMEDEERRRQAAIKKRAAELGDEHWTWNAPLPPHVTAKLAANTSAKTKMPYSVVRVGFAEIDSTADVDRSNASGNGGDGTNGSTSSLVGGTKPRIMRFNMKKSSQASGQDDDSNGESEEGTREVNRGSGSNKSRKRPRSDTGPHKKKDSTKLKHLTSLSSQGGQSTMKCHRCGRPGHKAASCPSEQRKPGSRKR